MRNNEASNAWWDPAKVGHCHPAPIPPVGRAKPWRVTEGVDVVVLSSLEQACDLTALVAVEQMTKDLAGATSALRAAVTDGMDRMRILQEQGLSFALPVYQNGYLYCAHRRQKGIPRRREYVGNDPDRVRRALNEMSRGKQYIDEVRRIHDLMRGISAVQTHAQRLVRALELLRL